MLSVHVGNGQTADALTCWLTQQSRPSFKTWSSASLIFLLRISPPDPSTNHHHEHFSTATPPVTSLHGTLHASRHGRNPSDWCAWPRRSGTEHNGTGLPASCSRRAQALSPQQLLLTLGDLLQRYGLANIVFLDLVHLGVACICLCASLSPSSP